MVIVKGVIILVEYNDNNYYYNIIRRNIRKYRKEKELTQRQLAEKVDLSEDYICEIESLIKNKGFSIIVLGRIADVLKVDIRDFFVEEQ